MNSLISSVTVFRKHARQAKLSLPGKLRRRQDAGKKNFTQGEEEREREREDYEQAMGTGKHLGNQIAFLQHVKNDI